MKIFNYCPSCGSKDINFDNVKEFKCTKCSFNYFQNVAIAAAGILEFDDRILFIIRAPEPAKGMLDLPGGFIDPQETAEDGLRREIKEELDITIGSLRYLYSFPNIYKYKGVSYNTCDLYFHSKIESLPVNYNTAEITELVLAKPQEISPKQIGFESTQKAIELFKNKSYHI